MFTVLVTGGLGFIGSHVCLSLIKSGYRLIIIDSLVNCHKSIIDNIYFIANKAKLYPEISFFKIDINDKSDLEVIFKNSIKSGNKINAVFHFAGLKSVSESFKFPNKYWETNVDGTLNIIDMMIKFDCKYFLFSSSASVYDHSLKSIFIESDKTYSRSPYAKTKLEVERVLSNISKSFPNKFKFASLRYFNPVGAHESHMLGEFPKSNLNNLFPNICKVAIGKLNYLKVYGKNWDTKDGYCLRDFIHISDIAKGHVDIFKYLQKSKDKYIVLNLGSGKVYSILEVIKTFEKINNCKVPYKVLPPRLGEVPSLCADINFAKQLISWKPKNGIYEMCRDSYLWFENLKDKNLL